MATKLTGRWQFRIHTPFIGKDVIVLQVEVECEEGPSDHHGMPRWLAGTFWRDATPADFVNGEIHHLNGLNPR